MRYRDRCCLAQGVCLWCLLQLLRLRYLRCLGCWLLRLLCLLLRLLALLLGLLLLRRVLSLLLSLLCSLLRLGLLELELQVLMLGLLCLLGLLLVHQVLELLLLQKVLLLLLSKVLVLASILRQLSKLCMLCNGGVVLRELCLLRLLLRLLLLELELQLQLLLLELLLLVLLHDLLLQPHLLVGWYLNLAMLLSLPHLQSTLLVMYTLRLVCHIQIRLFAISRGGQLQPLLRRKHLLDLLRLQTRHAVGRTSCCCHVWRQAGHRVCLVGHSRPCLLARHGHTMCSTGHIRPAGHGHRVCCSHLRCDLGRDAHTCGGTHGLVLRARHHLLTSDSLVLSLGIFSHLIGEFLLTVPADLAVLPR